MGTSGRRAASLLYGPEEHHLDHLSSLCAVMQIPLFVTEEEIATLARTYYPFLEVILLPYFEIASTLVENYEILFISMPRPLFDEIFFFAQKLSQKKIHTIWCPHGNSDKGNASSFMEALKEEQIALMYGEKMRDLFLKKGVFKQLKAHVFTGNIRLTLYKQHRNFYKTLVEKELSKGLSHAQKTILFAPTWQDAEASSSFFEASSPLIRALPSEYNLIIKLHPNLLLQAEEKIEQLLKDCEDQPNLLFLLHFPPIYPLLDSIDIYIGDMSSIGYDFLYFDRPMFFLNQNRREPKSDPGLYLYRCGVEIKPEQYANIYAIIQEHLPNDHLYFSEFRREVYNYAFGAEKPWEELRKEIVKTYDSLPDEDLNFFM